MVVYIHNKYLEADQYPSAQFIQNLIGGGICRIANCLFFCMSGYLFARNIASSNSVKDKVVKRIKTLLPPYILWNLIFVFVYICLDLIPILNKYNNNIGIIDSYYKQTIIENIYYIFVKPAAFQLWFIRDLIIMFIFTPVLCYISRKSLWLTALFAIGSIYFYNWLIYFWVGITIGIYHLDIEYYPKSYLLIIIAGIIYLSSAIITGLGFKLDIFTTTLVNLLAIYFIWAFYDKISKEKYIADEGIWKYICGYSFFIYCFHEPSLNIIKKLALALCGTSEKTLMFFYIINPWIMIAIAIFVAKLIQHIMPRPYRILTGGR